MPSLHSEDLSIPATDNRQVVRRIPNVRHFPINDANEWVFVIERLPVAKQVLWQKVAMQRHSYDSSGGRWALIHSRTSFAIVETQRTTLHRVHLIVR